LGNVSHPGTVWLPEGVVAHGEKKTLADVPDNLQQAAQSAQARCNRLPATDGQVNHDAASSTG
jgi:hypothetical protein